VATAPIRVILPIQYLRGVAALMVVWWHAVQQVPDVGLVLSQGFGSSGVDLFFVISGFIMVVTAGKSAITPREFLRRRVIRVVPLYWVLTLAMVSLACVEPNWFKTLKVAPLTLAESLLFIPHFSASFPNMIWPLLVPGWTLNYEMYFYVIFAACLLLPIRFRMLALALVFGALVAIGRLAGPFDSAIARTYLSPLLLEFVAGAAIGWWWLSHRAGPPALAAVAMVAAGCVLIYFSNQPPLGGFSQMIGAALVVLGALHQGISATESRLLRALGDASYSIYLTHLFTLGALRLVWVHAVHRSDNLPAASAFMAVAMLVCAGVGYLVFRWIETPLLARLGGHAPARRLAKA